MPDQDAIPRVFRNLLQHGDLSFRDFMEIALYHPEFGYYARPQSPVGRDGDFITSPELSPAFSFALSRLVEEFARRYGDGMCTIVDVGCGDGSLIHCLAIAAAEPDRTRFVGIDRWLDRVRADASSRVAFGRTTDEIPRGGAHMILSNELFDSIPFCRVVQRGGHLHELGVTEREGRLDWSEREAAAELEDYFASRAIELTDGQFADISPEWGALYGDICGAVEKGLIVTFDYGYPENRLFQSRARRFGTAAAYSRHRVSRDLLASPGEQDLTAHINFDDLKREGERRGFSTLFFDRQAKFLLALGITNHELFRPSTELEVANLSDGVELLDRRDAARQLVLPDTIGHDIRVLVQGKGNSQGGWTFELPLF
jgi:SAM-dependent MidA family methyltransferase